MTHSYRVVLYFPPIMRRFVWWQWAILSGLALGVCGVYFLLAGFLLTPAPAATQVVLLPPFFTPTAPSAAPTLLPTNTSTATPTETPSPTPSFTSTPTSTDTPTPTPTDTPVNTPTPTFTYQPTSTPLWGTAAPSPWITATPSGVRPPTLDDFWEGRAVWQVEIQNVGLPIGESDTLIGPDGRLWSYLHASWPSRGIRDQWGVPVPFPGCVTLWTSADRGAHFNLYAPQCLIACQRDPCSVITDDIDQQQYPRVAHADDGAAYMAYEWRGQTYFRTSPDGLNWSASKHVKGTGQWYPNTGPCQPYQLIGPHPLIPRDYGCLSGAPPGLFVEGDWLYIFVGMGKNPAHLGCYSGLRAEGAAGLQLCAHNPLFGGAGSHGPAEDIGPGANPYFDFHIISSADVLRVGERYYLTYEGIRGNGQFNLGLARSLENRIDGPWEKYPGNPILLDVPGNVGVGHADVLVLDGITYLYTATSDRTRGRYVLVWKP
ncbi:MAG: hypothetical protein ACRDH2_02785 [Anaerolineales bacterium]